jgi:hypothetical protein
MEHIKLLNDKTQSLEHILKISQDVLLTGTANAAEKEAEAFVSLYHRRENILKHIMDIDNALKNLPPLTEGAIEAAKAINRHREIAGQLLELDEANMKSYELIKSHLAENIKGVRQTRDVNEKYLDEYDGFGETSYLFDKKN